jgi:serine/threonine protein kinase
MAANSDLKALLTEMLNKDPNQRIGSDSCEMEILQHAYFEEQ